MKTELLQNIESSTAELLPLFLNFFDREKRCSRGSVASRNLQVDLLVKHVWDHLHVTEDCNSWTTEDLNEQLRLAARLLSEKYLFSPREIESAKQALNDSVFGEGPLAPLYADVQVTDIIVRGPKHIQCVRAGQLINTDISFSSLSEYEYFLQRRLPNQWAGTWFESVLDDAWGTRLVACSAQSGYQLFLRIPRMLDSELLDWVRSESIPLGVARWLEQLVVQGEANILVVGAPNTGKTTLLRMFLQLIKSEVPLTILEHLPELVVAGSERASFHPQVLPRDLGSALAYCSPGGRVVIGELGRERGAELFLQAKQSGLRGNMGALLANTAMLVIDRNLAEAVDVVIELESVAGVPRMRGLYESRQNAAGEYELLKLVGLQTAASTVWVMLQIRSYWLDRLESNGVQMELGRHLVASQ